MKIFKVITLALFFQLGAVAHAEEYIVKYKNEKVMSKISGHYIKDIHYVGQLARIEIPAGDNKSNFISNLRNDQNIEYIVPNTRISIFNPAINNVNTKALKKQYAITKTNVEKAWARAGNKGSKSIVVAVLDTGVDYNHKNLSSNMIPGYDFYSEDVSPMDETSPQRNRGHGTHCAGIVGGNGLVDDGIIGVSPEVSIMPLRFMGPTGNGTVYNAIRAIDYAVSQKVDIISSSWSAKMSASGARPLIEAIERANRAGVIHISAAANDGKNNDSYDVYPSNINLEHTMAIAASNSSDGRPSWSNYGPATVSIAAPGDAIMSTLPNNRYENMSGTSMATPFVAGLAAFLKAQDPSLTGAEIKSLLQSTGKKVSIKTECNCRVDAFAAVDTLLSKKPWLIPAVGTLKVGNSLSFSVKNAQGFVKYESSKPSVATIDPRTGVLVAKAKGKVTVKATDEGGRVATSAEINILK